MRITYLAYAFSLAMMFFSFVLIVPIIVAVMYHEYHTILPFLVASAIALMTAITLKKIIKGT